jgi:hypothetical protein
MLLGEEEVSYAMIDAVINLANDDLHLAVNRALLYCFNNLFASTGPPFATQTVGLYNISALLR